MNDRFSLLPIERLLQLFLSEDTKHNGLLGIPKELYAQSTNSKNFSSQLFGQVLEFPLGVAAGPHSQLAQNIISAWLCGARYIELKTIQTLDELDIEKPCIDMQDEGYNCEWSQELKIEETFNQYLDAWILIHVIDHKMGTKFAKGTIFNMSVGYNLEGILKDNVQWFLNKMKHCPKELETKIDAIRSIYPDIDILEIPSQLSNSITLSTMHGCPPDEIESIASYLIENKGLNTYVKLNPTLLGPNELRKILTENGKYKTDVPDLAFEHDLKYADAIPMIKRLTELADKKGVEFGLKLTNTLESKNHKSVFSEAEMMYMSGRALHPISVNVARKLQNEFNGRLAISFAGGADAFNFPDLLACGLSPVTVSSDLLKPGGYTRLLQYRTELEKRMESVGAKSLSDFVEHKVSEKTMLERLNSYADEVLTDKRYQRSYFVEPNIKGVRKLNLFDCIAAPCKENCAASQDIPEYLYHTAQQNFDAAWETILKTNSQPGITGNICDHLCQLRCTRINYDDSLQIREIKRFIEENHSKETPIKTDKNTGKKIAIIGAGPSGLSAAYYLCLAGFSVEIFEEKQQAGGMVSGAVPSFRLNHEKIQHDLDRVLNLGAKINYNTKVDNKLFDKLYASFDYLYLATGAPNASKLDIPGIESEGVIDPLTFLFNSKLGENPVEGKKLAIIGGGNTAMDAARVAHRLVGESGFVTVIYRRTKEQMPADLGEIKAVQEEGIALMELVAPKRVLQNSGEVVGVECVKMNLKPSISGKQPKPEPIPGSEFILEFDFIIPAVGQEVVLDFIDPELFKPHPNTHEIRMKRVFTGGDAMRGAATAIKAIADGRKIAEHIARLDNLTVPTKPVYPKKHSYVELMQQRAFRKYSHPVKESPLSERKTFKPVSFTLSKPEAVSEASRCLNCDEICNICVTVCPNRANYSYEIVPVDIQLYKASRQEKGISIEPDKIFSVKQKYQILNIGDFCNECGNCDTFCPTSGAPYKQKPRFYLTIQSFNEASEGYFLSKLPNQKQILIYKEKGGIRTLEYWNGEWVYETDHVKAVFNGDDFKLLSTNFKVPCAQQVHFDMAAEMKVLYHAAEGLY
ncbi:MAG: putative selenate reductase subunit YgfK [Salinivirgaceae bacterium]